MTDWTAPPAVPSDQAVKPLKLKEQTMEDDESAASAAASLRMAAIQTERIRTLNDRARSSLACRVLITAGVQALGPDALAALIREVRTFDRFDADNDPHGEHDFGAFNHDGTRLFWKIDYYDRTLEAGSPDPADPQVTVRVLTLMLADEY